MNALIRAELRGRWKMIAGLSAGLFGFMVVMGATFESLGVGLLGDAFANHTPKAISAFSGTADANLLSPAGWLGFGFNHPLFLVLSLTTAIAIPAGSIAGEVESGRASMLFVRPRSRRAFLCASVAVWGAAQLIVVASGCAGALLGGAFDHPIAALGVGVVLATGLQGLTLFAFVAAVAFLASSVSSTRSQASGIAIAATAVFYLANFVSSLVNGLGWLRWLSPFAYYEPVSTMSSGFCFWRAAVLLAAAAVLLVFTTLQLDRRDL